MDIQSVWSNIVVASLIGALAMTIGRHGHRAALAHVLWIAFFLKLVTPPIWKVGISIPYIPILSVPLSTWQFSWPGTIWNWVLLVWLAGFLLLLIRGILLNWRFAMLLHREGQLDQEATTFVASLLDGKRKAPPVIRLPVRLSPMLFGSLLGPKIVCPDELWGLLRDDQRRAFLAHETAHFFRRDHWVRWLEWIVTAIYWWFPGVYFGREQMERHEEACCDAWAINRLGTTPRAYAETLLSVVDFVSEHQARLPRLANGMQPTYTLEERLRLLMRPQPTSQPSKSVACSAIGVCAGLWLLHPTFAMSSRSETVSLASILPDRLESPRTPMQDSGAIEIKPYQWPSDHTLPSAPSGFWNSRVEAKWADFRLHLASAHVKAEAGKGIAITPTNGTSLHFSTDDLVAMAEIPSTGRLVIGDVQGRLRLWDLQAGAPVSLIGKHSAAITSVTYHSQFGLVSGDRSGQIVRWDLDSGLALASHGIDAPVQAIRYSADGNQLAVMTGTWRDCDQKTSVVILDSKSFRQRLSFIQPHAAATLVELALIPDPLSFFVDATQWFTIDWHGQLRSVENTDTILGQIEKDLVSSLVFAQQNVSPSQIAPPAPIRPTVSEPTEFIYVE